VLRTVKDTVTSDEVYMFLETPGKRGRTLGEDRNIDDHKSSIAVIEAALKKIGYEKDDSDGGWDLAKTAPASQQD